MRRLPQIAIAAALLSAVFAQGTRGSAQTVQLQRPAAADSRVVIDEVGRRVAIPATVNRIVSLAPNLTEIVYALGAADRLVGDTNYCDTPPAAQQKPHVGDPQRPSLEAIVALHPDLVLATTSINNVATADAIQKLGIPVYTSDPNTVRGVLDSIVHTADVIGSKAEGEALAASLRARLEATRARVADKPLAHVIFLVWLAPPMSIGVNTFIADALRWAGAESVLVTDQRWPQPSLEEILRLQPDYIVSTAGHEGAVADLSALRARTGWRDLMAVKLGRVVTVSEEIDRPSPGLVNAIEELAHKLHPDVFASCAGPGSEATCAP